MQDCPSCGNEIPVSATRCKYCFHDLTEDKESRKVGGVLVGVLLLALIFVAAGFWTYNSVFDQSQLGNVTIDPKERRVVLVYTSLGKEPTTRQIPFDKVSSVEMLASQNLLAGNQYEVFLVLGDGEKVKINSGGESLEDYANTVAKHTSKSLTIINNIRIGQDMKGFDNSASAQ